MKAYRPSRIIDCHLHLGTLLGKKHYTSKSLARIADLVTGGVVSYLSPNPGDEIEGNAKIAKAQSYYAGKFLGAIWINPQSPSWEQDALKYANIFKAIKIHPELNSFPVSLETLSSVFDFANKHNLPVATHSGGPNSSPEAFLGLVTAFPQVKLLLAHMKPLEQALSLSKEHDNVYLETSNTDLLTIVEAIKKIGCDDILHGSDFPSLKEFSINGPELTERYRNYLDRFWKSQLSNKDREKLFNKNPEKVFDL